MLWYGTAINGHKPVHPRMYRHVQLVTILRNLGFLRSAHVIQGNGLYVHINDVYVQSTPLKNEFLRIVTSCTGRYVRGCTSLCRFIALSYYSMVCRTATLCYCKTNLVYTGIYQYVNRQPWYILVYTSMYAEKAKW